MGSRKHFRGILGHRRGKTWVHRHPWQGWQKERRSDADAKPSDLRRMLPDDRKRHH